MPNKCKFASLRVSKGLFTASDATELNWTELASSVQFSCIARCEWVCNKLRRRATRKWMIVAGIWQLQAVATQYRPAANHRNVCHDVIITSFTHGSKHGGGRSVYWIRIIDDKLIEYWQESPTFLREFLSSSILSFTIYSLPYLRAYHIHRF